MSTLRNSCLAAIILSCTLVSSSCAARQTESLIVNEAGLSPCPDSPNCVSSYARDDSHQIAPLTFSIPEAKAWQLLKEQVVKLPRTVIVTENPGYLHVECRSAVFGFA